MNNTHNPTMATTTNPDMANNTEPEEFTQEGNDMTDIEPILPFNFSKSAQAMHKSDARTDKVSDVKDEIMRWHIRLNHIPLLNCE